MQVALNRRQRRAQRSKERRSRRGLVRALLTAGTALSMLGSGSVAGAQTRSEETRIQLQYSYYRDWQQGGEDRITVNTPQFLLSTPIGTSSELEVGLVFDTVSGASPLYHDTLSGASGVGIDDNRLSGDLKYTTYFEDFSIGIGGSLSHEDDYDSAGASIETRIWNAAKTSTLTLGVSGLNNDVGSTNDPDLSESNYNLTEIVGLTQVLDKHNLLQTNLTYASNDGFLNDPYKLYDNRPGSREQWAWLVRHVWYISSWEAALHSDYRYYRDTWGIDGHTAEIALYQPLSDSWIIRPSLRFYSQGKAEFYGNEFPPEDDQRFYTADQRLSGFGALTTGVKLIHDFGDGLSANVALDFYQQRGEWQVFGRGSPHLDAFYEMFVSFGIEKRFK